MLGRSDISVAQGTGMGGMIVSIILDFSSFVNQPM